MKLGFLAVTAGLMLSSCGDDLNRDVVPDQKHPTGHEKVKEDQAVGADDVVPVVTDNSDAVPNLEGVAENKDVESATVIEGEAAEGADEADIVEVPEVADVEAEKDVSERLVKESQVALDKAGEDLENDLRVLEVVPEQVAATPRLTLVAPEGFEKKEKVVEKKKKAQPERSEADKMFISIVKNKKTWYIYDKEIILGNKLVLSEKQQAAVEKLQDKLENEEVSREQANLEMKKIVEEKKTSASPAKKKSKKKKNKKKKKRNRRR